MLALNGMEGCRSADFEDVKEVELGICPGRSVGLFLLGAALSGSERLWSFESPQVPDTSFLPLDSGRSPWSARQAGP